MLYLEYHNFEIQNRNMFKIFIIILEDFYSFQVLYFFRGTITLHMVAILFVAMETGVWHKIVNVCFTQKNTLYSLGIKNYTMQIKKILSSCHMSH